MKSVDELKNKISELLDKAQDKDMIAALTSVGETIKTIEADTTALEKDNRELLDDYKEMIKHTSFRVDKDPERGADEPVTFDSLFDKAIAEANKKD